MQAHAHAGSVFDPGVATMSVKLTMKRMQGYATAKKPARLNVALVSRLKMFGKIAKDKASNCCCSLSLSRNVAIGPEHVTGVVLCEMEDPVSET